MHARAGAAPAFDPRGPSASGACSMRAALGLAPVCLAAALLGACEERASEAELDRWLAEVRAADEQERALHASEDESAGWTLTVLGATGRGAPRLLGPGELEAASTETVRAAPPLVGAQHAEYRGARIDALVARAGGAPPGVDEVTLIAADGFRATIAWSDVIRAPIILATHRDGERLRREDGGPLLAVFPLDEHPDLLARYTESWWVYYVTHLVVGTPAASVRIGTRDFDDAALAALPESELVTSVGYRVGWPSEPVRIVGPSLAALFEAAGLGLDEGSRVRVMTIAAITRGDERPTYVSADEVRSGGVLLGRAYGPDGRPIPARLGGPLVLAFSAEVARAHAEHDWLTFVTELRVEAPEPPP